ncbi:MAG TPA: GNAT family protein, partial [Pyrinomonadaceae bacterium]|nr:GNAT family protein [Pyrinomonadaceae bacterium]
RALIDHAFNELKLNRVEIRCGFENTKSRRIPEKLGFKEEGVIKQAEWLHDRFIDLVIYATLANEWQANKRL